MFLETLRSSPSPLSLDTTTILQEGFIRRIAAKTWAGVASGGDRGTYRS